MALLGLEGALKHYYYYYYMTIMSTHIYLSTNPDVSATSASRCYIHSWALGVLRNTQGKQSCIPLPHKAPLPKVQPIRH
jgi:hypothetical protein